MIVSASRRTDIPAFYSEWFMNRVRAGFCLVPNPFNPAQVSRVSLRPDEVEAVVFWSKDPLPMLGHLADLERDGFRFYFQFTLNDYPGELEPNLPPLRARLRTFKLLGDMIGPERVVWRYDPIIISSRTDRAYHISRFRELSRELSRFTRRVMVSMVTFYAKTRRNLGRLVPDGYSFDPSAGEGRGTEGLLRSIAEAAGERGIEVRSCASARDYTGLGIPPGRCIDGELIERLWGVRRAWKKDPGQRETCGCAVSRDIGMTDSCLHGCPYCYATRSHRLARERHGTHDPSSTALLGSPDPPPSGGNGAQGWLFG